MLKTRLRLLVLILVLLFPSTSFAANRFFVGDVDDDWQDAGNWSGTSGGAGGAGIPTTSDDVFFDVNSPSCEIDGAAVGLSIDFTGYTGTITFNATLTITTNITLAAGMSVAGASALISSGAGTLTSNGLTLSIPVNFEGNVTKTLADTWDIDGTVTFVNGTTQTLNGGSIQAGGSVTFETGSLNFVGTTTLVLNGTGTYSGQGRNGLNMTINTAGTITISGVVRWSAGTDNGSFTYTAGTVVTTGSTIEIFTGYTLTGSGVTFNNVSFGTSGTVNNRTSTLGEDLNVGGTLVRNASTTQTINGNQMFVGGSLELHGNGGMQGTTEIVMNGTGTWSQSGGGTLRNNLTINTAGIFTISGLVEYDTGTLTYTAGTIVHTGSTIDLSTGNTVLDLNGATIGILRCVNSAARTITLASGLVIAGGLELESTDQSAVSIVSSSPATQRVMTVLAGAQLSISYINVTDVNSTAGETVYHYNSTLSNTDGWVDLAPWTAGDEIGGGGGGAFSSVTVH